MGKWIGVEYSRARLLLGMISSNREMASKKKGQLTTSPEWGKHLRPLLKRWFWKGERRAEKLQIAEELEALELNDRRIPSDEDELTKRINIVRTIAFKTRGEDSEVFFDKVESQIPEPEIAGRLMVFLPNAYCRLYFRALGFEIPETYQRILADNSLEKPEQYNSDGVYTRCFWNGEAYLKKYGDDDVFRSVVERSATFSVIFQMLDKGSKLEDIVLTPEAVRVIVD